MKARLNNSRIIGFGNFAEDGHGSVAYYYLKYHVISSRKKWPRNKIIGV